MGLYLQLIKSGGSSAVKIFIAFTAGAGAGCAINFLALRLTGARRESRAGKPARRLAVAFCPAAASVLLILRFGLSSAFLFSGAALAFLLLHTLTDMENGYIYDCVAAAMVVTGAALRIFGGVPALIDGFCGALTGFCLILAIIFLTRGAMGQGDAALLLGTGALLGWRVTLAALYFCFVFGGAVMLPLLLARKIKPKDSVPLAPFMTMGALAGILAGKTVWQLLGQDLNWPWVL